MFPHSFALAIHFFFIIPYRVIPRHLYRRRTSMPGFVQHEPFFVSTRDSTPPFLFTIYFFSYLCYRVTQNNFIHFFYSIILHQRSHNFAMTLRCIYDDLHMTYLFKRLLYVHIPSLPIIPIVFITSITFPTPIRFLIVLISPAPLLDHPRRRS